MKPSSIIWLLALTEWFLIIRFIKRYGSPMEDPEIVYARMPLGELWKLRCKFFSAIFLTMTAQIMWWLP